MHSFKSPIWILAQVMAWIPLRDQNLVDQVGDQRRARGSYTKLQAAYSIRMLEGSPPKSFEVVNVKKPPKDSLGVSVPGGGFDGVTLDATVSYTKLQGSADSEHADLDPGEEIVMALQRADRSLSAFGRRNGRGSSGEISEGDIHNAIIREQDKRHGSEPWYLGQINSDRWWGDLTFRRDEVLEIWPEPFEQCDADPDLERHENKNSASETASDKSLDDETAHEELCTPILARPGSYDIVDSFLLEDMLELIKLGKARSANDAARILANEHEEKVKQGLAEPIGQSPDSVRDRLRTKFSKRHPDLMRKNSA